MKNIFLVFATLLSVVFTSESHACMTPVSERNLYDVNMPGVMVIKAQTGDMVRLEVGGPLVPGVREQIQFNDKVVRLVGKSSQAAESISPVELPLGSFVRTLYFRVVGEGRTTIQVRLLSKNGDLINKAVEQKVEAVNRPTLRCM